MGLNFKQTTKGKVGDIIYPAYNGTNGFWKTERWDLVMIVDSKDGTILHRRLLWDHASVAAIEAMRDLELIRKRGGKGK